VGTVDFQGRQQARHKCLLPNSYAIKPSRHKFKHPVTHVRNWRKKHKTHTALL